MGNAYGSQPNPGTEGRLSLSQHGRGQRRLGTVAGRCNHSGYRTMTAPLFTRPALWEDVLDLARRLNRHGARYVLVGGYALAAHGLVRMTTDIDIAVAPDAENNPRWVAALSELPDGVAAELVGEADPFAGDLLHAIRVNDAFTVDIMPSVAGVPFAALLQQAEALILDGESIPVLNLEGLLATKAHSERPKDQADAALLRAALARLSAAPKPQP